VEIPLILVATIAFFCELVDSSLGMGYGTSLTPLLLLMGFEPMQIVPCVLFSEFVSGMTAAVFHHRAKNANFSRGSADSKVAVVLSLFSVVGVVAAIFVAVNVPKNVLKLIIGLIVLSMAVLILFAPRLKPKFSWKKISILGAVASLNKGLSGGGYGPLVTGGQMLSGVKVKNAVAITSLAESVTCLAGVILYFVFAKEADWTLAPWLTVGALLSVPLATLSLKKLPEKAAKVAVGVAILLLGSLTLAKLVL